MDNNREERWGNTNGKGGITTLGKLKKNHIIHKITLEFLSGSTNAFLGLIYMRIYQLNLGPRNHLQFVEIFPNPIIHKLNLDCD